MDLVLDPDLNCQSAVIGTALDHWRDLRASRTMPGTDDLDALRIPRGVLPHITLLDIEYEPRQRFRWRLIGTAVTGFLQRDLTGRYWDAIYAEDDFNLFAEPVNWVLRRRAALRFSAKCHAAGKDIYDAEHLYLPLSRDGERVDRLFGVSVFEPRAPFGRVLPPAPGTASPPAGS